MNILREQQQASNYRGLPVNEKNDASSITSVTGETVQLYYSSTGTRTADAGQAAGVAVMGVFAKNNLKNSDGRAQGSKLDTSLSFTSTAFTSEQQANYELIEECDTMTWALRLSTITAGFTNGQYVVDYNNGCIYGVKASTQSTLTSTAYKVNAEVLGSVTIDPTGLAVSMTDDSAFTPGSSAVNPVGFFADETATDSVDEGDIGAPRMTLNRRVITASDKLDDAAFGVATDYTAVAGFLADETATDSVDEGDSGAARMTLDRRQIIAGNILDDAAFGVGTSYVTPAGALADESGTDSVDEGDTGALRMTLNRRLITAGQTLDDAAYGVATEYSTVAGALADETGTDSVDEGDAGAVRMTLNRRLITSSETTDDAAMETGTRPSVIGAVADETATDSVDEGDAGYVRMDLARNLRVTEGSLRGPGIPAIDSYTHASINLAAGNDQVLVASAANKQIWVYGIGVTVNVAGTVSFQDEDNLAITGIIQLGTTGGFVVSPSGNFSMPIWKLATDKDLEVDVVTSELDGWIDYAIVSV